MAPDSKENYYELFTSKMFGVYTFDIIAASAFAAFAGYLILRRVVPALVAAPVALLKAAIPLYYFTAARGGDRWYLWDDVVYFREAESLLLVGYSPWNVLLDPEGLNRLYGAGGGRHISYFWWNMLSQWLWGPYYWSTVFMNVVLTFLAAYLLYKLALQARFSVRYAQGLALFFLLHWDVLAWSSFVNLKDVAVLLITIFALYTVLRIKEAGIEKSPLHFIGLAMACYLLFWTRFYIVVFLSLVVTLHLAAASKLRYKLLIFIVAAAAVYFVQFLYAEGVPLHRFSFGDVLGGAFRFSLTPRPWSIVEEYSFLTFSAFLHWLFFLPALVSGYFLWKRDSVCRTLILYAVIVVLWYAVIPEYQGVRQRFQVTFVLAMLQFNFLWMLMRAGMKKHPVPSRRLSPA